MKKIITNMVLLGLFAALAACGGSDSGTANNLGTGADDDVIVDPIADVQNDSVGLGTGTGTAYVSGEATVGIASTDTLSASGSTTVTVNIVNLDDNNVEFLGLRQVYFTSVCAQGDRAEFTPAIVQASGLATATYQDKGCGKVGGTADRVIASIVTLDDANNIVSVEATAVATINVAPAEVGAIQFSEALPDTIALRGVGSATYPELSVVEFIVVDRSGNPMSERTVKFELDHDIGGVELSKASTVTDQDGIARVQLQAGHANGSVRVKASIDITDASGVVVDTVTTQSNPIGMATGLGDENSFTLGSTEYNPAAFDRNGTEVDITARLADHYQNPVPDGTQISFTATGGTIEGSCLTANGACSVVWTSSNPRPVDGIVTILARTVGEGNFQDANSNGMFDLGERYQTYGEVFIDANGSGTYDLSGTYQPLLDLDGDGDDSTRLNILNEFHWDNNEYTAFVSDAVAGADVTDTANFHEEFFDFNNDGILTNSTAKMYQGVNCSDAAKAQGHCAELVDINASIRLQMSASASANIEGPYLWDSAVGKYDYSQLVTCVDGSKTAKHVAWRVSDSYARRNNLAAGSKISLEASDVNILSETGSGDIESASPELIFTRWSAAWDANPLNPVLSVVEKKHQYLNERGHFIQASIIRPDSFTTIDYLGTLGLKVDTVNGPDYMGNNLKVDLRGITARLASSTQGVVSSVDIKAAPAGPGAQSFTLVIENLCGEGLEQGTLIVNTSNGIISAPGFDGSATSAVISDESGSGDDDTLTAAVNNSGAPTVVMFTLTTDTVSDLLDNALSITLKVPNPDFAYDDFTNIADYSIQD